MSTIKRNPIQKVIQNQSEKCIVIDSESLAILKQNIEDGVRSIILERKKREEEREQTLCYKFSRFLERILKFKKGSL